MLAKERIKEAETNVRAYLGEDLLKKEALNGDCLYSVFRGSIHFEPIFF